MDKIDTTNMNIHKSLNNTQIQEKICQYAFLLNSNKHIKSLDIISELLLSSYEVVAKFKHLGFNGDSLKCNSQILAYRPKKFSPVELGKNVKLIQGKFSDAGGSHNHPSVGHSGKEITLKFISYGLPDINRVDGWSIEIISINKIN